ncbi:MAG: cadherin-like beta sandwich domain-containing protein [Dysgonamonadaceae bacterium]|jgi:hypothetical protein|nr:cadherin-like beta sandwich domain-containing protein [Dysgonamonadaceae bacterium]
MKTISIKKAKALAAAALSLMFAAGVSAVPTVISTDLEQGITEDGKNWIISDNETHLFTGKLYYNITVLPNASPQIIFENVTLNVQELGLHGQEGALNVQDGATVRLTIIGENTLIGGSNGPGIAVPEHATLIIDGNGKLNAEGGYESAGIGGGEHIGGVAYGTIIINNGHIIAKGGTIDGFGSGIGDGGWCSNGTIIINGGTVEAFGRNNADIGGSNGTITINGGTVSANTIGDGNTVIITGGSVVGNPTITPTDLAGNTLYPIEARTNASEQSFSGHTLSFNFNGSEYAYRLNDVTVSFDDALRLWFPRGVFPVNSCVIKNSDGRVVFTNMNAFEVGVTPSFRFSACDTVYYSIHNLAGARMTASFVGDQATAITSGGRLTITDDIRFEVTGMNDTTLYRYRWEYITGGSAKVEYTMDPYLIVSLADNGSTTTMRCYINDIDSCALISYRLLEGDVALSIGYGGQTYELKNETSIIYAVLGDTITLSSKAPAGKYEYSITVNDELKAIDVKPVVNTQIVTGAINAEYSAKRMEPIRFPDRFIHNGVTFNVSGKYTGNTYSGLSAGKPYDKIEPLPVKNDDWITPGGSLLLTINPDCDDDRLFKYIYNGNETFYNEWQIDSAQLNQFTEITAKGPYYPVRLSLLDAPAGTTLTAEHGTFVSEIHVADDWQNVSKLDTVLFEGSQTLTLRINAPQQAEIDRRYKWSGIPSMPESTTPDNVLTTPNVALNRAMNIVCGVLYQHPVAFSLSENIPGLTLTATYDDSPVETGGEVWSGGKLSVTVSGDSAHLYRYAWDGVEEAFDRNALIERVIGRVEIQCTPRRIEKNADLASLFVNTGNERISVWDGESIREVTVSKEISEVLIEAIASASDSSTISGDGTHFLAYGKNEITVTVESNDGATTKTYRLTITRKYPDLIGNTLFWEPRGDTLIIRGSGKMYPFALTEYPWYPFAGTFKVIVLEEGVDFLGDYAFINFFALEEVINRNATPQSVTNNVFNLTVKGTLYVPAGAEQTYKSYPIWQKFNVIGVGAPTSIAPLPASFPARVYLAGQTLYIDTPEAERISIYSLTGKLLHRIEKPAGISSFHVPSFGVVIIKGSSGWVRKVVGD